MVLGLGIPAFRHQPVRTLTSAGRQPGFPSKFSVCGVVNDSQLVQGCFVESPGVSTSGASNVGRIWLWHHVSCWDAGPQYHQKVNVVLELYFCGNSLSKHKQLQVPRPEQCKCERLSFQCSPWLTSTLYEILFSSSHLEVTRDLNPHTIEECSWTSNFLSCAQNAVLHLWHMHGWYTLRYCCWSWCQPRGTKYVRCQKQGLIDPYITRCPYCQGAVSSSVGICREVCLKTVGLTEANVATVLAGWLSKWTGISTPQGDTGLHYLLVPWSWWVCWRWCSASLQ